MLMRYQAALRSDRAALPTKRIILFAPQPRNGPLCSGCPSRPLAADGIWQTMVDLIFERVRGAENENPARADRHFLAGLGVAADAASFLPHGKTPE